MTAIVIERAGPLTTIQDSGRPGALRHGISASGPMDRGAFDRAGAVLGRGGSSGIEFTRAGLAFTVEGTAVRATFAGGAFELSVNGRKRRWGTKVVLRAADRVDVIPGAGGNYGYVRFEQELDVPVVLGSRATNTIAGLGGYAGRPLRAGDRIELIAADPAGVQVPSGARSEGPIRVVWGLHADRIASAARESFTSTVFEISPQHDRMGVRLVARGGGVPMSSALSLVSDAIVPGDVQILGDGTPIVLMRDHQPTGGYTRIATVITADFDRFAQLRSGAEVRFVPVTAGHARALLLGKA